MRVQDRKLNIKAWRKWYKPDLDEGTRPELVDDYIIANVNLVKRFWKGTSDFRLLEAGCGSARSALALAKEGAAVFGLDIVKEALLLAKDIFKGEGVNGEFILADMAHMPFIDGAFDVIFAGGSIEHLEDTLEGTREVSRVLADRGVFIAEVPLASLSIIYYQFSGNIPDIPIIRTLTKFLHLRLLKGRYMKFGYEKAFTERSIRKIFQIASLSNVNTGLFDVEYPIALFENVYIKNLLRKLAHLRPFWPMIYIKGEKWVRSDDFIITTSNLTKKNVITRSG